MVKQEKYLTPKVEVFSLSPMQETLQSSSPQATATGGNFNGTVTPSGTFDDLFD